MTLLNSLLSAFSTRGLMTGLLLAAVLGTPAALAQQNPADNADQNATGDVVLGASPSLALPPTPALSLPANQSLSEAVSKPAREVIDESARISTIDLIEPPKDLWQRIRNGFGMPDLIDPLVTSRQAWYLNRPDYLRNTLQRSRRYLYHIVEELEKRGMPTELALLPLVESSFNPQAASPARALGMWQFIPSTGKNYKLEQNWWLDERRDVIASTNAALDYLQNIYEMNGDWHLALASYNWGEGAVARAMAKNAAQGLPTDYLSIRMPTETRYYVPKLQAVKNIIANPGLFNFQLDSIPNKPYFGTVDVERNMDVSVAARLADIPLTEFIALNPAYSRPVIPGGSENPLVIPADKVSTFLANLEHYESTSKPLSNWLTYQIKPKEKLETIAASHGISAAKLKQLNGITRRTRITAGMTLLVPGRNVFQADAIASALPQTPEVADKAGKKGGQQKPGRATGKSTAKAVAHSTTRAASHASARAPAPANRHATGKSKVVSKARAPAKASAGTSKPAARKVAKKS